MGSAASPDGSPSGFDIADVGHFTLETSESGSFTYYVCELPRRDGNVIRVLLYPENGPVDDACHRRVREATRHIVSNTAALLSPMRGDLAKILDHFEITEPANYDELFSSLELSHIKFASNDSIEIIFEACPATGWFNLNARIDQQLRIREIWFDG